MCFWISPCMSLLVLAFSLNVTVMGWMFMSPQNSYFEAHTINVTVLGNGVFRRKLSWDEIMRVGHSQWGLLRWEGDSRPSSLSMNCPRKGQVGTHPEGHYPQARRTAHRRHQIGTLILDFPVFRNVRDINLLFRLPSLWYFYCSSWSWLRWWLYKD